MTSYVGSREYIVDMLVSGFDGDLHTRDEIESWLDALTPPKPARRRIERDYVSGVNEQIVVKNLSVMVHETDEGVVVDIYPLGEEGANDPIATTYAFFDDVDCEGRPDDSPLHDVQTNEHLDAWCGRCGERLLLPGYAGGPQPDDKEDHG